MTVNNQFVSLPYKKFGVSIYESGINYVVEIPELKMNMTYNGLSFSIRLPHSLFGNNTQGQCGKAYSSNFTLSGNHNDSRAAKMSGIS